MPKKGYKQTESHRLKLKGKVGAKLGHFVSSETRAKIGNANRGRKHTEETRRKNSEAHKGLTPWNKGMTGFTWGLKGEKNHNWKGGVTSVYKQIRKSEEYVQWRTRVFERDNYTCIWCKQIGGKLNADHIKPFSLHPELRFELDNGRTLCEPCHRKTDTWGTRGILNSGKCEREIKKVFFDRPKQKNNTSGHKGVTWSNRDKKWQAQIKINQKNIVLGRFEDKNIAISARKKAELKYTT